MKFDEDKTLLDGDDNKGDDGKTNTFRSGIPQMCKSMPRIFTDLQEGGLAECPASFPRLLVTSLYWTSSPNPWGWVKIGLICKLRPFSTPCEIYERGRSSEKANKRGRRNATRDHIRRQQVLPTTTIHPKWTLWSHHPEFRVKKTARTVIH